MQEAPGYESVNLLTQNAKPHKSLEFRYDKHINTARPSTEFPPPLVLFEKQAEELQLHCCTASLWSCSYSGSHALLDRSGTQDYMLLASSSNAIHLTVASGKASTLCTLVLGHHSNHGRAHLVWDETAVQDQKHRRYVFHSNHSTHRN